MRGTWIKFVETAVPACASLNQQPAIVGAGCLGFRFWMQASQPVFDVRSGPQHISQPPSLRYLTLNREAKCSNSHFGGRQLWGFWAHAFRAYLRGPLSPPMSSKLLNLLQDVRAQAIASNLQGKNTRGL